MNSSSSAPSSNSALSDETLGTDAGRASSSASSHSLAPTDTSSARPHEGQYLAAGRSAKDTSLTHAREAYTAAENRLRAAHRVVADSIDRRFAQRVTSPTDADPEQLDEVNRIAQALRDDLARSQQRLSDQLAARLQRIAAEDSLAAHDVARLAGAAADNASAADGVRGS